MPAPEGLTITVHVRTVPGWKRIARHLIWLAQRGVPVALLNPMFRRLVWMRTDGAEWEPANISLRVE